MLYRLLGYLVWRAVRFYLRERLPSRRVIALSGLAGLCGLAAAGALSRRAAG